ncbi:MAG TPA: GPP34 family phosphoprotein [bacterium]|nr:GPP34 family phosphoprotein [bacterium]
MLTIAEEVYLLFLDDQHGAIIDTPVPVIAQVLAGALLMELTLGDYVEAEIDTLRLAGGQDAGEPLLDEALRELRRTPDPQPIAACLQELARPQRALPERVLARLLERGILRREERRLFWVLAVRQYPLVDDREVREVKTRLRALIMSDDLPDPRDVVLISLASSARLFDTMFTPAERIRLQSRIDLLARFDLVGQVVARSVRSIEQTMTQLLALAAAM